MGFHWKSQFLLSTKDPSHNSSCHGIPTSSASPCFTSKLFIPCDWGWACRELAPPCCNSQVCMCYAGNTGAPEWGYLAGRRGVMFLTWRVGDTLCGEVGQQKTWWVVWAGIIMIKRTPSLPLLCRQSWWSYRATEYFIDGKLDLEGVLGMWILVSQPPSPDGWSVSVPTWFLGHRREQVRTIFFQWGQPVFVPWTWEEQTLPCNPARLIVS